MTIMCEGYDPRRPCPVECQAELLLHEFRAFREELSAWKQETGERVTAIETAVKPAIQGNGQPSRLSAIEARVTALERVWWKVVGASAAVWAILTLVLHFIPSGAH